MPEIDQEGKDYGLDIPVKTEGFFLKGSHALDWGMKNRLSRIFNPDTGRTVMLAIDHGYFQGPTTGLERIDLNIVPSLPMPTPLCSPGVSCAPRYHQPIEEESFFARLAGRVF